LVKEISGDQLLIGNNLGKTNGWVSAQAVRGVVVAVAQGPAESSATADRPGAGRAVEFQCRARVSRLPNGVVRRTPGQARKLSGEVTHATAMRDVAGAARGSAALGTLALGVLGGFAGPPPEKQGPPKPLPKEVVKVWKAAGAKVGWMRVDPFDFLLFLPSKEGKAGDLPAFRFPSWKEGVLAKLPAPEAAFGLDFTHLPMTDTGLKELTGLKSLRALCLHATQVTEAGLKGLAGLKDLQALSVGGLPVTDAGLKELAGLKGLRALSLGGTQVTDAGLKGLAALKELHTLDLSGTRLTGAGLKELAGLKGLQTLNLAEAPLVTGAGLKAVGGL
jgi:hypothetical protein